MVILLNGSLKGKKGNGYYLLQRLKECEPGECAEKSISQALKDSDGFVKELEGADALVIAAPLYVDGLPAQVLRLMEELYEHHAHRAKGLRVYVLSNLGFYESAQILPLMNTVRNWCARMGVVYGGGAAVGAGGMMSAFRGIPLGKGPNKALGEGLSKLACAIREGRELGNLFLQPSLVPRFAYKFAAHRMFKGAGRRNGVKV